MARPLQEFQGQNLDLLPYPAVFAPDFFAVQNQAVQPLLTPIEVTSISATSLGTHRPFFRSGRGRCRTITNRAASQPAQNIAPLSQVNAEIQDEGLVRPPPFT